MRHVIVPNSRLEIFTGARAAMGVCWSTAIAAELVAAERGVGKIVVAASKFQDTDMLWRRCEGWPVPWKSRI